MGSYHGSVTVHRPAREVFDWLKDPANIPKYVPTSQMGFQSGGEVHIEGDCPDQHYLRAASFRVDPELMRVNWDSAANVDYRGWMSVSKVDSASEVTIHLEFEPGPDAKKNDTFRRLLRDHSGAIQEALEDALAAIRAECEGTAKIEVKGGGAELL
jgi:uncharacterized protein YndB with AHSA1/START domain